MALTLEELIAQQLKNQSLHAYLHAQSAHSNNPPPPAPPVFQPEAASQPASGHPPASTTQDVAPGPSADGSATPIASASTDASADASAESSAVPAASESQANMSRPDWGTFDYPEPTAHRHEYSGPSGALCRDCRAEDHVRPLTSAELKECLVHHSDIKNLTLFRLQSFPIRPSMPDTSVADLTLSDEDRARKLDEYGLETYGDTVTIKVRLLEVRGCAPFTLKLRKFEPKSGDLLTKSWVTDSGEKKEIDLGPWAIADVSEYVGLMGKYIQSHHQSWCFSLGSPVRDMVQFIEDRGIPTTHRVLFDKLATFMFAAVQKSSTAVILEGSEALGVPEIREEGHRLHGCKVVPRMVLGQQDPIDTLAILIPAHRDLMNALLPLYNSAEYEDWGAIFVCLTCLIYLEARLFQDRRRHAYENSHATYYTMPEFVRDASAFLIILITKFHDVESSLYTRDECLAKGPIAYKRFFQRLSLEMNEARHSPTDIHKTTWWLGQLLDPPQLFCPHKTPDWPLFDYGATEDDEVMLSQD